MLGPYIVEIDGDSHGDSARYDNQRTAYLNSKGYCVIRFSNAEIMGNMDGVLQAIVVELNSVPLPIGEREK